MTDQRLTPDGILYPRGPLVNFRPGVHYQFGPYHRVGRQPWFRSWVPFVRAMNYCPWPGRLPA